MNGGGRKNIDMGFREQTKQIIQYDNAMPFREDNFGAKKVNEVPYRDTKQNETYKQNHGSYCKWSE